MKLQACDIILFRNDKNDPVSRFSRWAIGPYSHVAMYLGKFYELFCKLFGADPALCRADQTFTIPLVYESRGRGVMIASLLPQAGVPVAVMRPVLPPIKVGQEWESPESQLIKVAFEIAADEKSLYDYSCIVYSCVPRVLKEKFPWLPLPVKYHRDIFMICSEAVAEVFWRNEVEVVPKDVVPLPGDFALSPFLQYVGEGKLMEDINV